MRPRDLAQRLHDTTHGHRTVNSTTAQLTTLVSTDY